MTARAAHAAGFGPAVRICRAGRHAWWPSSPRAPGRGRPARQRPTASGDCCSSFHHGWPHHVSGAGFMFWVFHVIRDYARTLRGAAARFSRRCPAFSHCPTRWRRRRVPLPIVFGHNDLLPANFLDDGARLWLIDYEYAGFGTAMFDLAGAASNAGMSTRRETDALLARLFRPRRPTPPSAAPSTPCNAPRCCARRCGPWSPTCTSRRPASTIAPMRPRTSTRLDAALAPLTAQHGTP